MKYLLRKWLLFLFVLPLSLLLLVGPAFAVEVIQGPTPIKNGMANHHDDFTVV